MTLPTINVKEAGYLFTYLSYEDQSNNFVYFDDYKVTYTPTNIVQYNEYYPYGLQTATSWTRENATGNNFLGNGGTELNATSGLYDLEYRNYDPALARMHQVDPMADKYASYTPYNYSFNAPSNFNDVNGADPNPGDPDHFRRPLLGEYTSGNNFGRLFGGHITPGSGGNWSDSYRPVYANMGLMSQSTFLNYYGINDDQSRFNAGLQIGQSNGARIDGLRAQQLWSYYSSGYNVLYGMTSMGGIQSIYTAKLNVTQTGPNYWASLNGGVDLTQDDYEVGLIGGGLINGKLDAHFLIEGVKADGLQVIQTVAGSNPRFKTKLRGSFVDGGLHSPWGGVVSGKPYYNEGGIVYNSKSMSGSVDIYDAPLAQLNFKTLSFETAIIAINYNGTGSDKVLASFQWGFTNYGTPTTNVISLQPNVSAQFLSILKNDYPNYSIKN